MKFESIRDVAKQLDGRGYVTEPVDQTKFAAAVAKEVGMSLAPKVALYVLAALLVLLLIRYLLTM